MHTYTVWPSTNSFWKMSFVHLSCTYIYVFIKKLFMMFYLSMFSCRYLPFTPKSTFTTLVPKIFFSPLFDSAPSSSGDSFESESSVFSQKFYLFSYIYIFNFKVTTIFLQTIYCILDYLIFYPHIRQCTNYIV